MKTKLLRVGVLALFAFLISGFVAHKAGFFKESTVAGYEEVQPIELTDAQRDSIQHVVDSLQLMKYMMSSSKVMMVYDDRNIQTLWLLDSLKLTLDSTHIVDSRVQGLHAAKHDSAEPYISPLDSLFTPSDVVMPASKSGRIFTPDPDTLKAKQEK